MLDSYSISIIEDDANFLEAIVMMVDQEANLHILNTYSNTEEALENFSEAVADIVMVDINLPKMSGIQCVANLKIKHPKTLFLMCTSSEDSDKIFASLQAGASGYILKTDGINKITGAIYELLDGGSPMSASIARKVVESFNRITIKNNMLQDLTLRETEVLDLLAKGLLSKEVADLLNVSTGTIRKHIQHIYEKLHVNTRVEAVNLYLKREA